MCMFRDIFHSIQKVHFSIKLPSIHWKSVGGEYGVREAEKRAGLISNSGDLGYKEIFELAKKHNFNIIFDGYGINHYNECSVNA